MDNLFKVFIIADNHFGHEAIIKHCQRPFKDVKEMNEVMYNNWQRVVGEKDMVLVLGDIGLQNRGLDWNMISSLKGNKILVRGNHDRKCLSKNTRLLTQAGYKYYWELKEGELIPTANLTTGKVEYKPIQDIYIYKNEPYLYVAENRSNRMEVNSQHIVINKIGSSKCKTKWDKTIAENLWRNKTCWKVPVSFSSGGSYVIEEDYLKLLAWIMTDGHIEKNNKLFIYQSKPDMVKRIEELLIRLNIKYIKVIRNRLIKEIMGKTLKSCLPQQHFVIDLQQSQDICKKLALTDKYTPPRWVHELSDEQFKLFWDELVLGDGHTQNSGSQVLWGRRDLLEKLLGLCVTHGLSANLLQQKGYNKTRKYYPYLCVRANSTQKQFMPKDLSIRPYNDVVWCINVENHTLFVELEGKTFVTGNSNHFFICHGFVFVCNQFVWGKYIFTHNPLATTDSQALTKYLYNFHGHIHQKTLNDSQSINVSVEQPYMNYTPQLLSRMLELRVSKKWGSYAKKNSY